VTRFYAALLLAVLSSASLARTPPAMATTAKQVDQILVDKSERRLQLLRGGKVIRTYRVRLGNAPIGHKLQQGDERTPEGVYRISGRNANSHYHLSLRVSYPNDADRRQARMQGVDPGGDIMIHGGNSSAWPYDWTDGCIAVTNSEIEEIWSLVPTGTRVLIVP
jgi:murein L,D-transpeptidase YafK